MHRPRPACMVMVEAGGTTVGPLISHVYGQRERTHVWPTTYGCNHAPIWPPMATQVFPASLANSRGHWWLHVASCFCVLTLRVSSHGCFSTFSERKPHLKSAPFSADFRCSSCNVAADFTALLTRISPISMGLICVSAVRVDSASKKWFSNPRREKCELPRGFPIEMPCAHTPKGLPRTRKPRPLSSKHSATPALRLGLALQLSPIHFN